MSVLDSDPNAQRFQNHALHGALQSSLSALKVVIDERGDDPPLDPGLSRLRRGLLKAESSLAAVDGAFVASGVLKEAWRPLNEITSQLTAYRSDKQDVHIVEASTHLENVLIAIQRMPKIETQQDASSVGEMLQAIEQQSKEAIEAERNRLQIDWQALEEYRSKVQGTIDSLLANEGRLTERVGEQEQRLEKLVERTDAAVAEFNARATDAERARDQQFGEVVSELRSSVGTHIQVSKDELAAYRSEMAGKAMLLIASLEEYKNQASTLLQVIGEIGVASPFDKTARADRRAALVWRLLAGAFFAGMVGTVVATAIQLTGGDISWQHLVFRFMTALIFAIPAFYFAREASKFQEEADRNRRLQLELAALGPFLENLEPSKRFELREKLTEKYFGGAHQARELEKPLDPNRLFDILTEFARGKR